MPAVLAKIKPGTGALAHLIAQAGNDGKYLPTLVLVAERAEQILIAKYKGVFMLPQGRIRDRERFEDTSWRILAEEFGMELPHPKSEAWSQEVTQIAFYHRNELDPSRRSGDVQGKMLMFVKVSVPHFRTNLATRWNETQEPNPPEMVEWVRVNAQSDIEVIRQHYFNRIRTDAKREAELAIIAFARGITHAIPS